MVEKKILNRKEHEGREDLTGEHVIGDAGQLILFVIFFAVWISDSFFYKYTLFFTEVLSIYIRLPVSIIIFVFAGYLAKTGLNVVFGTEREKPEVINSGVFKIVRHPIYLASILLYLAFLVFSFSILAFVIWVVIILFYHFIAKHEEKLLLEKFGKDYEKYRQAVPMWIPGLK